VNVRLEQAFIDGLNLKTFRGTAKERLRMPVEPWNVEETGDTRRNLKGYNALL